jgi:hypothetical protein
MHPEIMRELGAQHGRDMRERAHRAQLGRTLGLGRRAIRRSARNRAETDAFAVPAIPDYVDGSFRSAGDEAAAPRPQAQVPAARRAA